MGCQVWTDNLLSGVKINPGMIPSAYILRQNYPNPFNPEANITFSIPRSGIVLLKVYDISGAEVAALLNEEKSAGSYTVRFDASGLASGIYFCKIQVNNYSFVNKMVLLR
jgi:hypothetical protein